MTSPERFDDGILARLLGARHATGDPATLARALARVRSGAVPRGAFEPAWLAWLGRPVALVTAASLLVVSLGAGIWIGGRATPRAASTTRATTDLIGSLLADEGGADTVLGDGGIDSGTVQ